MKSLLFIAFLLLSTVSYGQTPLDTLLTKSCDCFKSVELTNIDLAEDQIPDCLKRVMNISKNQTETIIAANDGINDEDELLRLFIRRLINECDAAYQYYIEGLNNFSNSAEVQEDLRDLDKVTKEIEEQEISEHKEDWDEDLYLERGLIYFVLDQNYIGAIEEFQKARQVSDEIITEAAFFEGYAYYKMGDYQNCVEAFRIMMTGEDADEPIFYFVLYMAERRAIE